MKRCFGILAGTLTAFVQCLGEGLWAMLPGGGSIYCSMVVSCLEMRKERRVYSTALFIEMMEM